MLTRTNLKVALSATILLTAFLCAYNLDKNKNCRFNYNNKTNICEETHGWPLTFSTRRYTDVAFVDQVEIEGFLGNAVIIFLISGIVAYYLQLYQPKSQPKRKVSRRKVKK